MNVIETIQKLLTDSELMDQFNGCHIDYTESEQGDCGLFSMGSSLTGEDLVGNEKYRHSFVLFANMRSLIDYDRLNNSSFLLELTYWLNHEANIDITATISGVEKNGTITKITTSNAMLYTVPTGDANDGVNYQLQMNVDYTIKEE